MKTLRSYLLLFLFTAASLGAAEAHIYQCPMHPWIKADHPGKCTVCGMDLVLAGLAGNLPAGTVMLDASTVTVIGVETAIVARQPLTHTLRVAGRIDDDDTRHRVLSARVSGRVETLHVDFVGARFEAGAPLVTLYSPEMLAAKRVYLERLKAGELVYAKADLSAAREQLQILGISAEDLAEFEKTREPSPVVVIRAPEAGTVVAKFVYQGQYVQTTDRLFETADFSQMWFVFDVYEQDIPWLRLGQKIEITTRAVPGEIISAPIAFIDPNFDETTRTTKVRAVISNPHVGAGGEGHRLPHRVLAEGRVGLESPAVLAAPRSAVLDSGGGPVAYVATGERRYEQRRLKLGRRGDALVEVLDGLNEGDSVVTNGALLVDAQAQLAREATLATSAKTEPANGSPRSESMLQPSAPRDKFAALANAAADAAATLAADDFTGYQKVFPAMLAAAEAFPDLPKLARGENLKSARLAFEPWSTTVADLLKPQRASLGLKVFQCPMAPVLGQGRWVQRSQPLKNPFFGAAMPNCGEEVP